jgi:hypothetical protein
VIIPFNSSGAAPSGWTLWNSPAGKDIIGAQSGVLAIGATGGSNSRGITLPATGNHAGSGLSSYYGGGGNGGYSTAGGGNHSHTATLYWYPPYRQLQFIKANAETPLLPTNGVVLGHSSFSGPSNIWSGDGRFMRCHSSLATGGGGNPANATSSSAGNHRHCNICSGNSSDPCSGGCAGYNCCNYAMTHTHTVYPTLTTNGIYRTYLTAWSNASADFGLEDGMIAMYESFTPPTGWSLCDGTGGTPDLRQRFVEFGTTGNHGTTYGDGNVRFDWTVSNHPSHTHMSSYMSGRQWCGAYQHTTYTAPKTAHQTYSNAAFTQPYYALAFIKYTG